MKKIVLRHIVPLLIAFILGAIMFQSRAPKREKCIKAVPAKAINYITTTNVPVIVKEVRYQSIRDTVHDTIKMPSDSALLAQDWLTKRYYNPTILNDTNGIIKVNFMVTKNRLASWKVEKKLFVHSYKVYVPPRRKLLLGAGVLAYPDHFGAFGGAIYQDRRDRSFEAMYDPINKGIFIAAFWKLNFREK